MVTPNPTIDHYFPYRGHCALCGGPDARHRLFDAIWGYYQAGDSVEALAEDYGESVEAIAAVVEWMGENNG